MKKSFAFLFICLFSCSLLQAQDDDLFSRKGKILLETGYNLVAGVFPGTGLSLVQSDGQTITSLAADMGYFLQENFALKFRLGVVSGGGATVTSIGAGGKYYIAGVVPVEATVGLYTGNGTDTFGANFSLGYAVGLAPNILLEPSFGAILGDEIISQESIALQLRLAFAMIL
ncbi:MAG: hypothetical protein AAF985_06730 [Bacteroidota bacterium]